MPTQDHESALSLEVARARIAVACFTRGAPEEPDRCPGATGAVGLEPELFPYALAGPGRIGSRVPLRGTPGSLGVLDVLEDLARTSDYLSVEASGPGVPPSFRLKAGGRITFEPGGQVEHSTRPFCTGAEALSDTHDVFCFLERGFQRHGVVLVSTGVDPWSSVDDVPQQLDAPRYRAMERYFDRRGPFGRKMMRLTASQQVNLDLGGGRTMEERWLAAHLAAPLATASFANSPDEGAVSARAIVWQTIDPTRSGYPPALVSGEARTAAEQYASAALAADVLLFRSADGAAPGTPGFSFETWLREGHPEHGRPTLEDLDYHLTTLFFEVRPRGFFEVRTTDALPAPWLVAPVVLWTGLLYDDRARGQALDLLEAKRARLPELWSTAARAGLADPEIGPLAPRLWTLALEGAARLPEGYFAAEHLRTAESFLETFTWRGLAPSDHLRKTLAERPERALEWAVGEPGCTSPAGERRTG